MKLVAEAFAKVNRSLVVLGKRPDGYHELDTLFQAVGLTDRLSFEESDGLTLEVDDPSIPSGAENLVLRAARTTRFSPPEGIEGSSTSNVRVSHVSKVRRSVRPTAWKTVSSSW